MATTGEHVDITMTTPHSIQYCGVEDDSFDNILFAMDTHPSASLLAIGDISGNITLYSYHPGQDCNTVRTFNHHKGFSCRALKFSKSGNRLFSGSSKHGDLYTIDVETGKMLHRSKNAHSVPLYSMHTVSEGLLASGDEKGDIRLWDTRSWRNTMDVRVNKDFISNMATDNDKRTLLTTSGDGSLTAVDLRQRRLEQQSDCTESELLSLAIVKGGRKVVCGDGEGNLMIYNWGLWGDITDRYPGHPQAIDCLVRINDSVICTGCTDGLLRSVHILPNQILANIGHHTKGLPVDAMCLTHDRTFLVTCSHDSCYFWAVEDIQKLMSSGGTGGEERDKCSWPKRKRRKRKQGQRDTEDWGRGINVKDDNEFFADLCS